MPVSEGKIVEGTVTGITNFGAFVEIGQGKSGLVHISEISHDYVEKVSDYVKKGQKVKVKILSISDDGKISLSMRQTMEKSSQPSEIDWSRPEDSQRNMSFEDKMNSFLKQSNERHDQLKNRDSRKSNTGSKSKEYQ